MRKELDRVQRIIERENEREQSSESLFLPQDDDPETLTQVGPDTVSYGPFFGLKSARKRVHESESPEVSSGPFMGLTSAKKRVRETESLEERSEQIFDSAKEVAVDESVNDKEGSTTSFGPRKKIAKKAGTLKNV